MPSVPNSRPIVSAGRGAVGRETVTVTGTWGRACRDQGHARRQGRSDGHVTRPGPESRDVQVGGKGGSDDPVKVGGGATDRQ